MVRRYVETSKKNMMCCCCMMSMMDTEEAGTRYQDVSAFIISR